MQNYPKANSSGRIVEIDEHRWRGREERLSAAYYYSQSKYANDATNIKTPQAVLKVIGYRHGTKEVRGTIEYIARIDAQEKGEELVLEKSNGELIKGKEAIAAIVKEWKADFDKSQNSTHIKGENAEQIKELRKARHATHILLSADCEPNETNYAKLEKAARDLLQREFADKGYDYLFVVHKDTQHPHVHVVVKNKQRDLGQEKWRKLKLNPNDLLHLRRQFAYELERNGIEQIATRSVDEPARCLEALKSRIEGARKNLTWYQAKMQEPDRHKESRVDLQKYANNLQREITRIRQLTIEAKMPIAQKQELAKEYKKLMIEIGALRKGKEADLARQSVDRFREKAKIAQETAKAINTETPPQTALQPSSQGFIAAFALAQSRIDEKLATLQIRAGKAEGLERQPRILEIRRIQRLAKRLEGEIKRAPYDRELRLEQLSQVGHLRKDLRNLRREPKPQQKALNEYGLDLNFDHAAAVRIGEARTAREQIKEANAGIVVIERQIKDAEQTIKSITESKIDGKERRQHIKDLTTIKDRFVDGYAKHIKEAAKLIESAIAADKALKSMPASVKRKERELLHKTMESYAATLGKSLRFCEINKLSASKEIRGQKSKIERSFEMGLGL
jgi:hypothetical protein